MGQSTQTINIHERPKKKMGRPRGTGIYTEEENTERAIQRARLHSSFNYEKERERKRLEYHAKKECCLKLHFLKKKTLLFEFPFKQLAN